MPETVRVRAYRFIIGLQIKYFAFGISGFRFRISGTALKAVILGFSAKPWS
jgi:hypothetical protein